MGKELYPRFRCVLCGWLAHYSMLERSPYKIEVRGMKVEGFGGISYHHVWGAKKMYKEFLRSKVRELCKELGLKLADEEVDLEEIEDKEIEVDKEEVAEDDLDELGREVGFPGSVPSAIRETPSSSLVRTRSVAHGVAELPAEDIEAGVAAEEVTRERIAQAMQAVSMSRLVSSSPFRLQKQSSIRAIETDSEFVEGGENNG